MRVRRLRGLRGWKTRGCSMRYVLRVAHRKREKNNRVHGGLSCARSLSGRGRRQYCGNARSREETGSRKNRRRSPGARVSDADREIARRAPDFISASRRIGARLAEFYLINGNSGFSFRASQESRTRRDYRGRVSMARQFEARRPRFFPISRQSLSRERVKARRAFLFALKVCSLFSLEHFYRAKFAAHGADFFLVMRFASFFQFFRIERGPFH